jgi:hypothetical protein
MFGKRSTPPIFGGSLFCNGLPEVNDPPLDLSENRVPPNRWCFKSVKLSFSPFKNDHVLKNHCPHLIGGSHGFPDKRSSSQHLGLALSGSHTGIVLPAAEDRLQNLALQMRFLRPSLWTGPVLASPKKMIGVGKIKQNLTRRVIEFTFSIYEWGVPTLPFEG